MSDFSESITNMLNSDFLPYWNAASSKYNTSLFPVNSDRVFVSCSCSCPHIIIFELLKRCVSNCFLLLLLVLGHNHPVLWWNTEIMILFCLKSVEVKK